MSIHKYIKEPFPALSHLLGVVLSIAGLIILLRASGNSEVAIAVSAIYGSSLITLYLASSLCHGITCSSKIERRLEQFDYAAIFLLIAGTYTPVCLFIIKGTLGWTMLIIEWVLAFTGIISIFLGKQDFQVGKIALYLVMGWLFLIALGPIRANLPSSFMPWLIGGGLFYSVGVIVFLIDWPPIWRGCFSAHDFWHLFVMGGSSCHFVLINYFVQLNAV